MNNEEKILALLERMQTENNALFDKLEQGQAKLEAKVDAIQEDVEIIKENVEVTREASNTLLDWAELVDHTTLNRVIQQHTEAD